MKKHIVFDVDRTLVDSYKPEMLSLQEAIKIVTGKTISNEEFQKLTTLPTKEFFKYLELSNEKISLINKEWEKTFSKYKTTCFEGIKDVIKKLYLDGYTLGIITSRTLDEFHELDSELSDIKDYFKVIITSDKITNPKPHKDSMITLCNELNCYEEDIIYIGDSYIDKEFARNSFVEFIPACWENKELINEENACISTNDLLKIIELLETKKVIKAGSILLNTTDKTIALVYREKQKDYTFPKGHVRHDETLKECALRETNEETKRECIFLEEEPIYIEEYMTPRGEDTKMYYYLTKDIGPSNNDSKDTHPTFWIPLNEVYDKLTYDSLKKVWQEVRNKVEKYISN